MVQTWREGEKGGEGRREGGGEEVEGGKGKGERRQGKEKRKRKGRGDMEAYVPNIYIYIYIDNFPFSPQVWGEHSEPQLSLFCKLT